jgi:hypothetical protein
LAVAKYGKTRGTEGKRFRFEGCSFCTVDYQRAVKKENISARESGDLGKRVAEAPETLDGARGTKTDERTEKTEKQALDM